MVLTKRKTHGIKIPIMGVIITMAVSLIEVLILAYFVNIQRVSFDNIAIPVFVARMFAVAAGSIFYCRHLISERFIYASIHGALCLVMYLLCSLLILDNQIKGTIYGVISIVMGAYGPCVVGFHKKKGIKAVKYKVRNS